MGGAGITNARREWQRQQEWRAKGGGELWYPPHQDRSRVDDKALPFRAQHHLCRQEVGLAGSQKLRAQGLASVRRCGTEGRTKHQGWEVDTVTGTGTRAGAGMRSRTGTGTRIRMGAGTGIGTGTRTERVVEGGESPRTCKVIVNVGRNRERGGNANE